MGRPVENNRGKKKKKGRPSLLDLQKRSLRLQSKHQSPNPNPNPNPNSDKPPPNPYLRFPQPTARRPSRWSHDPDDRSDDPEMEADGDEERGGSGSGNSKRREKKLKLVLRIPPDRPGSDSPASGSEGDAVARTKKRPIGDVAGEKTEKHRSFSKAGEVLENGTPLPDKKLLLFILDRLQKKDTYGVFSEPVDAEELPDYHDIIEDPMDFGTIRKKLSCGVYANLEQFEKDVFLISSNAMCYNAPDTVYFRQARSIQDLAKKDFQNLRQASDGDEPEQKIARRGRPSTKNIFKKLVWRPPERVNNNSDATLANSPDNPNLFRSSSDARKNMASDKPSLVDLSNRSLLLSQTSENHSCLYDQRSEKNEEPSGSVVRNVVTKYGKKSVSEENHRNTCKRLPVPRMEPSVLSTFDGEQKELDPVGLHIGYAYARSLARFAVGLGSVAWEFAAKRIEMALPPGTKFGRGWVGEQDGLHVHQEPIVSVSSSSSLPSQTSSCIVPSNMDRTAKAVGDLSDLTVDKTHRRQIMRPPSVAPSAVSKCSSPPGAVAAAEVSRIVSAQDVKPEASHGSLQSKVSLVAAQIHENSSDESGIKRKIASSGPNPSTGPVSLSMQITSSAINLPVTQNWDLEVGSVKGNSIAQSASVSVSHVEVERTKFSSPRAVNSFNNFFHPPDSNDRAIEKVKLPINSVHTASVSHVEADRVHINSSAALVSGSSFPNPVTGRFDVERSKSVVTVDVGNSILHPGNATTKHLEAEQLKRLYTNLRNHGKNLTHPVLMSRLGAERMETSNYATISMNGFGHMSPPSHVAMEKSKLGNSGPMVVNSSADSVATSNAVINKTRSVNSSTSPCRILPESPRDSQGSRQLPVHQKRDSTPDLNVRFQSPTSPPSGMVVDSQQPDLVLQL